MDSKLKFIYKMETVLITITTILCSILVIKLLYKLRSTLLWRVNCWFCNSNCWMKFANRNCWTCPKCDQYNGFTKDGDYNKPLITGSDQDLRTPKVFQKTLPKNGLCKMCNINQQLKVAQLANFVPMNEKKFDEEIETYKLQLEKAYKLCSPCKKVLQNKLHKEKETLLGAKLIEARTPDKKSQKCEKRNKILKSFINNISMFVATVLIVIVTVEGYKNIMKHKHLSSSFINIKDILLGLLERIVAIIKMKTILTFPSLEHYFCSINSVSLTEWMPKIFIGKDIENILTLTQELLGGFVCLIQIIGHIGNINELKYTIVIDLLWSVFVITSVARHPADIDPILLSLVKLISALAVLFVYKSMKSKTNKGTPKSQITPKKMKNLVNGTVSSIVDEEDTISLDTDDDVSLNKFGLHNLSESSSDTVNLLNNSSMLNGRSFTPRSDSIWSKAKLNSTFCSSSNTFKNPSSFCINTMTCKSPSSVSDNVFIKPSFNKYQKLVKDDSDSELDESISSLCIGSPKKAKNGNSIFSLRKFTATPCFVAPTPLNRSRPLISPSKLGHSTSWVAGGYWGSEGERQLFNIDGSRSSSQSSGFESQASSMNQRNVFSQPPSREESVCGEPMVVDNFRSCNTAASFSSYQTPQNFSRINSPVFPQMQYNGHVHIPQPRFAQSGATPNIFGQQQTYVQNDTFKAPGGSGLIKLPQVNSFSSR